jgi:streptogramin lyase
MILPKRIRVLGVLLLLIVASTGGVYAYQRMSSSPAATCSNALGEARVLRSQLAPPTTFGGVTEYSLPAPLKAPNAAVVAPDGTVWFGEQSVPGVAHFYPNNRTLVEYAWPFNYPSPPSPGGVCGNKSDMWGVTLWKGKVWASDTAGNQLVALDPSTDRFSTVRLPTNSSYPYTLTNGPNGNLWFTELFGSKIGELTPNGTLREYPLPGGANAAPTQILFANSTTGYYDDVGEAGADNGAVYSFDVNHFAPALVGDQRLNEPSGITLARGALWVALHGSSSVASYNFTTRSWSFYPTTYATWDGSPVTTLPYFVQANGSEVWVNEHYGNRIAVINPVNDSLVEYAESDHPVDGNTILNAVTFALGGGKAWFTEWTGNGLGYVNASYAPGFFTSIAGNNTLFVNRGSSASAELVVHDTTYRGELNLTFSDSESFISEPSNMTFSAALSTISPTAGGDVKLAVTVTASESLKPGTYWATLTATDGLTYESSFLRIVVTGYRARWAV